MRLASERSARDADDTTVKLIQLIIHWVRDWDGDVTARAGQLTRAQCQRRAAQYKTCNYVILRQNEAGLCSGIAQAQSPDNTDKSITTTTASIWMSLLGCVVIARQCGVCWTARDSVMIQWANRIQFSSIQMDILVSRFLQPGLSRTRCVV